MKVIKATQQMLETRTLVLGFQGENLRTQLRIDCAATFAEYPNATPALAVKPSSGETYPVFVERDGNEVVWDIVANNLVLKGDGELQLTFYKDNVIAKTVIGTIRVNRSLQIDGEMPDVVATWIENANRKLAEVDAQIVELEGMVDTATDAATRAEQSASTASTKAEQAAGSAATATEKATEATNAAGTATAKAAEAQTAAQTATEKANAAAESERIATAKAVEATTAAGTATAKAEQATGSAQTATEKAGDASASATAAQASASNAAASATAASASETAAKASETAASTSATQAAQSAQGAGANAQTATQKAAEASQSATNAAASATNAATSAETASTKAGEAAQSAQTVEQTAEQLAESLEQISQNTADIAEHEQYAEATYAKKTDLSNLTSDLDLVQTSGTIVETEDAFPTFAEDVTAEIVPVQSGSGDPSPENIRPITGFDSVKVTRTGKNLLAYPYEDIHLNQPDLNRAFVAQCNIPVACTFSFTASSDYANSNNYWLVYITCGSTRTYITPIAGTKVSRTINASPENPITEVYIRSVGITSGNVYDLQLEFGSTATDYEPYHGIQVELPFGQTVYGGTIDLTTGVLTVDRAIVDMGESQWWYNSTYTLFRLLNKGNANNTTVSKNRNFCSCYPYAVSYGVDAPNNSFMLGMTGFFVGEILVKTTDYTDATEFKNAMSGQKIVYELATPITYNLTPAQVLLLRDYNVLWANTGDIINLEYRAGAFVTKKSYDALKEATLIHNTASGSIASFVDGAEMPVDEVTAQINPVQDLHGYDSPWPAGGGKNLAKFADQILDNDRTQNGITFHALSENQVMISGTATGSAYLTNAQTYEQLVAEKHFYKAGTYTLSSNLPHGTSNNVYMTGNEADGTPISGNIASGVYAGHSVTFTRQADFYANIQMVIVSGSDFSTPVDVWVQLESGSTATAWSPYSNICPISGFEGLTVTRAGKNLMPNPYDITKPTNYPTSWAGTSIDGDWVVQTGFSISQGGFGGVVIYGLKKGTYTFSFDVDATDATDGKYAVSLWSVNVYGNKTGSTLGYSFSSVRFSHTVTFVADVDVFCIRVTSSGSSSTAVVKYKNIQLELGSTATSYEPYQGETYTITFPSEAGTVYGGELTIAEDGSGVLTVDMKMVDLGTLTWRKIATTGSHWRFWAYLNVMAYGGEMLSSQYKHITAMQSYMGEIGIASQSSGGNCLAMVTDERFSDTATFKAAMSGVQLVYELAAPITYILTASQITTLLGENNLWHDANGEIVIGYKANTKLYIDGKIAELVAQIVNS